MAGITFDTHWDAPARTRLIATALAVVLALAAVALVAGVDAPSAAAAKSKKRHATKKAKKKKGPRALTAARKAACGVPDTLYASTDPASAYTMILRVNTLNDVKTYTQSDESKGGLQPRIKPQDIFLINTR